MKHTGMSKQEQEQKPAAGKLGVNCYVSSR